MAEETVHGPLLFHLAATLGRVAAGFVLAMLVGTALGIAMGRSSTVDRWLDGLMLALLNLPAIVLAVLVYIWLGLGELAVVVTVAVLKIPNVAVTIREGTRALERQYDEVAAAYRLTWATRLRAIVFPQLAPYIAASARNGFALAWKIVLVVELLGRSSGIGFELQTYFQLFDVSRVLAYAIAFIVCALLIDVAAGRLERRTLRWRV